MAGEYNSASRLGVTLQGYDQVLALSQANINQTLKTHFTKRDNAKYTKLKLNNPATYRSLDATIEPPTIQLVDVQNADQAIYMMKFTDGNFTYLEMGPPQQPGGLPSLVQKMVPVKGWQVAFFVQFSTTKMGQLPTEIRDQIQLPGSYSVHQLLIDFGTAQNMAFSPEHSKIFGGKDQATDNLFTSNMKEFISEWLLAAGQSQSHNVLAYAVSIDDPGPQPERDALLKKFRETLDKPSAPPTSLRLQTINHRPNGDPSATKIDHDYNAFLFTEMVDFNPMNPKDLDWTGDFFYGAIGGTMIISKQSIWDKFFKERLKSVNRAWTGLTNTLMYEINGAVNGSTWLIDADPNYGEWLSDTPWQDHFGIITAKNYHWENNEQPHLRDNYAQIDATIQSTVTFQPTENRIQLDMKLVYGLKRRWLVPGDEDFEIRISYSGIINVRCFLTLKAVQSTNKLEVEIQVQDPDIKCSQGAKEGKNFERYPVKTTDEIWRNIDMSGPNAAKNITERIRAAATEMTKALNSTNQYIFPGGGTFDMKDPVFNRAGDLMIGLTYRK